MAPDRTFRPTPLALAVLGLLQIGPLHPYGIQRLLKEWGKDRVVNVGNRANLYKTIQRLHQAGLVTVAHTEREQLYPERTVYELTDEGRRQGVAWLADMMANPRLEFPAFPAALSFAMGLSPDHAAAVLERRAEQLEDTLVALDGDLESYGAEIPRVALLDDEFRHAVIAAELKWVRGVVDDLRSGELSWDESMADVARESLSDTTLRSLEDGTVAAPRTGGSRTKGPDRPTQTEPE